MMPSVFIRFITRNHRTLAALAIVIPLGFYSKVYSGPASHWVNNSLGGVLYVIFWTLLFSVICIRSRGWKITLAVWLITCILELLQRWHPQFLEAVRATFLGRTLIGNSFSWLDMVHYAAGALVSLLLLQILRKQATN
jgi:hypothetical protein